MLKKIELRILEFLFEDLTTGYSMLQISKKLRISYPLTYNTIKFLVSKRIVSSEASGKSIIIKINLQEIKKEHVYAEESRRDKLLEKQHKIKSIIEKLKKLNQIHFICVLFGSYAKQKAKPESDIDLLFIIPEEYYYERFDTNVKTLLTASNVDINITPEKGLFEMWNTPKKFNVGNELLKGHITLTNTESFLELRRRYEYG